MDSWPLILIQYILTNKLLIITLYQSKVLVQIKRFIITFNMNSRLKFHPLWLLNNIFSQTCSNRNGGDKDDKCLPSLLHFWGPYVYCMLKVKEMTVRCVSVYIIDGFLGSCFISQLDPLTHFYMTGYCLNTHCLLFCSVWPLNTSDTALGA